MNDNYFQGDLFNEKVLEKKKSRPRIFEKYSQQRVLSFVRVPIEYIVIYSIGVLILIIIAYAIGVERGKSLSAKYGEEQLKDVSRDKVISLNEDFEILEDSRDTSSNVLEAPASVDTEDAMEAEPQKIEEPVAAEQEQTNLDEPSTAGSEEVTDDGVFIVQLASYKDLTPLKREMKKLEDEGVKAGWKKSGSWYQLFARGYQTADDAKKARNKLIGTYKDCYIRKVK